MCAHAHGVPIDRVHQSMCAHAHVVPTDRVHQSMCAHAHVVPIDRVHQSMCAHAHVVPIEIDACKCYVSLHPNACVYVAQRISNSGSLQENPNQ